MTEDFRSQLKKIGHVQRSSEGTWWELSDEVIDGFRKIRVKFHGKFRERYIRDADYVRKDLYPGQLRVFTRREV